MSDIEIATNASIENIKDIAQKLNLKETDLFMYGEEKAKIKKEMGSKQGNLILVTAMSPTPYGEGKTTVSIGLADALAKVLPKDKNVSLSLRQPSLGPVFGLKGGATGGGYSQLLPMADINLHFTGDFHALTSANNLISAAIYNHIEKGNKLGIEKIVFERCLDINDRCLRTITLKCHEKEYQDHFRITAASEMMALFCLAQNEEDLRRRLGSIIVGYTKDQTAITTHQLSLEGALLVLLKDAFYPNLVQTMEGTPCLLHGGPFANIAHGCSSIKATKLALSLSDYVITEAGFGADLGAEKFLNIVCSEGNFAPSTIVLVTTIRALKYHGKGSVEKGLDNVSAHLDHLLSYQVPCLLCLNKFVPDQDEDIAIVEMYSKKRQIPFAISDAYTKGGQGATFLAKAVIETSTTKSSFVPLLTKKMNIKEKLDVLAKKVYHASSIDYSEKVLQKIEDLAANNLDYLPICVAKTQYSISDDARKLGYPKDTILHVKDLYLQNGAGYITILLGSIVTMPGLPTEPNYEKIDIVNQKIIGLF